MKRNLITLIIAAVLLVIFALLLFTFQVRQSEVAVVTTFGKITGPQRTAGLHLRLPWPFQQVYKFDGRTQDFQDNFSENLTADNIDLFSSVYVGWKIGPGGVPHEFPGRFRRLGKKPATGHADQCQGGGGGQQHARRIRERGPHPTEIR